MAAKTKPHLQTFRNDLSSQNVRERFRYDRTDGIFTTRTGTVAGFIHKKDGYRRLKIKGVSYLAHRLAWLYETGKWPVHEIDHINGDRADNRIINLREANDAENARNAKKRKRAKHQLKGIAQQRNGRWMARIRVNTALIYLGTFDTPDEAHSAYRTAARKFYERFAKFG